MYVCSGAKRAVCPAAYFNYQLPGIISTQYKGQRASNEQLLIVKFEIVHRADGVGMRTSWKGLLAWL